MAKNTRKKQLLRDRPYCIYRGGGAKSTTWDHIPNKGMFPKDRPGGLEFPSCEACNQGSKWFEDIVSFIGSIRWDNQPEDSINHSSNKFRHLLKVHPDAIEEMRPPASANRRARQYAENASTFDLRGDIVSKTLHLYGAKLALALHWSGTGQILPCGSKIGVYCMSNERRFAKTVPQHLFELIPNHREIRQGKKASRYPFYYSSGTAADTGATAHWATFADALAYYLFVGGTLKFPNATHHNAFTPGYLQTPKPINTRNTSIGWSIGPITL